VRAYKTVRLLDDVTQVMKTEFVPKATTVVASCCFVIVAVSLADRLLTMRTLASTGYLDALVIIFYTYCVMRNKSGASAKFQEISRILTSRRHPVVTHIRLMRFGGISGVISDKWEGNELEVIIECIQNKRVFDFICTCKLYIIHNGFS